ncbi:MAG: hypothetical protein Q8755_02985, partial [Candidatus Phytoplasma australasiaticum]|nr:hypothetical protein [Candidatus Phytoplasma australasiaticum]
APAKKYIPYYPSNELSNERVAEALAMTSTVQPKNHENHNSPACAHEVSKNCNPYSFSRTEGVVGLLHWFNEMESEMFMSKCSEDNKVGFPTSTLVGAAQSWWDTQVRMFGMEMVGAMSWDEFRMLIRTEYCSPDDISRLEAEYYNLRMVGSEIEAYTARSHDLAMMCPDLSNPPYKRTGLYFLFSTGLFSYL